MAWVSGTATDYKDVLLQLKNFLTTNAALVAAGQAWDVLRYDSTSAEHELVLKGKGLGGTDNIFVAAKTYSYPAGPHYAIRFNGYTAFNAAGDFFTQLGALPSTYLPSIILRNGSINYWFIANGRRVIIITQAGSYWQQAYLGLFLPFGPSSFNAYPLFVGANATKYQSPVDTVVYGYNNTFWDPNDPYTAAVSSNSYIWMGVVTPVSNKANVSNYDETVGYMTNSGATNFVNIYPYARLSTNDNQDYWGAFRENIDGTYPLFPTILFKTALTTTGAGAYGMLDGVWALPMFNLSSGDVIQVDGRSFLVCKSPVTYFQTAACFELA